MSSIVVKEGQPFTIHLKGVGWTQLDNTVGVDYDNSYIGYGCGFNSNGDVLLHLHATGGPGTHLIDLYPMLYSLSPSFANTPYGMVPVLTYAQDEPGPGPRLPPAGVADSRSRSSSNVQLHGVARGLAPRSARGEASTRARRATVVGSHQFQRPSRAIRLGISRPRTTVASSRTPSAEPDAELLQPGHAPDDEPGEGPDHDEGGCADDPAGVGEAV